jgi:hypothetical protein
VQKKDGLAGDDLNEASVIIDGHNNDGSDEFVFDGEDEKQNNCDGEGNNDDDFEEVNLIFFIL